MKQKLFTILLLGSAWLFSIDTYAQSGGITKQQTDSLVKFLHGFPANTQLSIAIVKPDTVIYAGYITTADTFHEYNNRDSVFEIGSITKVFTSVLLSDFVNKGLLKTSDPVQKFFKFKLKQSSREGKEVTLENLANHTSGLPPLDKGMYTSYVDSRNPYKYYDGKMLEDYLQNRMKLDTTPGIKFNYSNLGGGLLGYILCQKAHKTYEELLRENIFIPLGMTSSTTDLPSIVKKMVKPHCGKFDSNYHWTFTDAAAGAGAIKSNTPDLAKFMKANFTPNKVYDLPRIKTFSVKEGMDIGLAWIIKPQKDKENIYWHNGGTGGYRSCMVMDVTKKYGVIVLSNISSVYPEVILIDRLTFALFNTLN